MEFLLLKKFIILLEKKNGICKYYYDNGRIKEIITYKADVLQGQAKYYSPEGFLVKEGNYFNGHMHGKWSISEDGKKFKTVLYKFGLPVNNKNEND